MLRRYDPAQSRILKISSPHQEHATPPSHPWQVPSHELESFIQGKEVRGPQPLPHLDDRIEDELHVLEDLQSQIANRFGALDGQCQVKQPVWV